MRQDPFEELRGYARDLERQVPEEQARLAVSRAIATAAPGTRRPRRAVVALATAGILTLSNVALAAAANPSVPGDPLYGLDRAYERIESVIGIGNGHTDERLDEATVLVDRGRATEALAMVEQILDSQPGPAAELAELRSILEETEPGDESETSPADETPDTPGSVHDEVKNLVDVARSMGGGVNGDDELAAERAQEMEAAIEALRQAIRDRIPADPPGLSDNPGAGNAEDRPGQGPPADPGPPEGVPGPPEDAPAGPSENPGSGGGRP